jgi:hypothetical protein
MRGVSTASPNRSDELTRSELAVRAGVTEAGFSSCEADDVVLETERPVAHLIGQAMSLGIVDLRTATRVGAFHSEAFLACRISDRAEGGQVLVSPHVRELTSAPDIAFASVGAMQLKGLASAVELFEARRAAR